MSEFGVQAAAKQTRDDRLRDEQTARDVAEIRAMLVELQRVQRLMLHAQSEILELLHQTPPKGAQAAAPLPPKAAIRPMRGVKKTE